MTDAAAFRAKAASIADESLGAEEQVDTYFRVPHGRLKLRESSRAGGQLVPYLRPDAPGPRRADYQVIPVADPAALKALLGAMLGVHRVVRKRREVWLVGNVRVHLDAVERLGDFMELEAVFDGSREEEAEQQRRVARLMAELGVREDTLVAGSYESLVS